MSTAEPLRVGIVGKYFASGTFTLSDSYLSVIEAVKHAAWSLRRPVEITWLNAEQYETNIASLKELRAFHALIIPGGFGSRGVEGKIAVIQYARQQAIPILGLCYGMQLMAVEFARHVLKWRDANTTEVDVATKHPVIDLLPEQERLMKEHHLGGSMRLGAYPCRLTSTTKTAAMYDRRQVIERHRHRYEFQNRYRQDFERAGMVIAGVEPKRQLVEILELPSHPWFVGTQFHPEFLSHPLQPHPLFVGLLRAGIQRKKTK